MRQIVGALAVIGATPERMHSARIEEKLRGFRDQRLHQQVQISDAELEEFRAGKTGQLAPEEASRRSYSLLFARTTNSALHGEIRSGQIKPRVHHPVWRGCNKRLASQAVCCSARFDGGR